jgi:hypothetical protein
VKRAVMLVVMLATLAVPAGAQEPPEYNSQCGQFACRLERVPADWYLAGVDEDLRTLELLYVSGGCRRGDGRALVIETGSAIRISVDESTVVAIDTPDRKVICTSDLRYERLRVTLERPVAGRRVLGRQPGDWSDRREWPPVRPGYSPRVIGLAAADAAAVLRLHGFKVRRFVHRRGTVTFQSPPPGKRVRRDTAGITLGRDAFDRPALLTCIRKSGVLALGGRPTLGDENAPDLELVLSSKGASGLVALYADPARAEDNERQIRRTVRGTHGTIERMGRVTIVWTEPPDTALRARVVDCVARARP